jgi:hypothetical protein
MRKVNAIVFRITWKRLNITLTPKDYEIIEAFVAKTLGKEF